MAKLVGPSVEVGGSILRSGLKQLGNAVADSSGIGDPGGTGACDQRLLGRSCSFKRGY